MRERLVELIADARREYYDYSDELHENGMSVPESSEEYIADHLIANGVVVLPCKVGDKVYIPKLEPFGEPSSVEFIVKKINIEVDSEECKGLYLLCSSQMMKVVGDEDFGRSVFFTKEEVKRALKGDEGK